MTAPDAMPERVEQPTVDEIQAGTAYITADPVANKVCNWMIAFGRRDAESRLLAAEARVREVEAAFKKYGDHWAQCPAMTPRRKCNCGYAQARAILAREAGE